MKHEITITDIELTEFCRWFAEFHGTEHVKPSVLTTCMCGHLNTYSKMADRLLTRCKKLGLVADDGDTVTIVNNNEKTTNYGI